MGKKQFNPRGAQFCAQINDSGNTLLMLMCENLAVELTVEEQDALKNGGWQIGMEMLNASKDGAILSKIKLNNHSKDAAAPHDFFYVYVVYDGKAHAYSSLEPLTRPAHVNKFLEELDQAVPGCSPEKWGKSGPDGLMYRGHNVFEAYTAKHFNERAAEIIKFDEEIRTLAKCDKCFHEFEQSHRDCKNIKELRDAMMNCKGSNRLAPDAISCQEVYLGYMPGEDLFISAWDVFGSENTGCVVIAFRINEDGLIKHDTSNGEYDRNREIDSIYDGGSRKFYEKMPASNGHGPAGPGAGKSMYELISGNTYEKRKVIDIRLD